MKHFRNLKFWKSATPIDYDIIVNDSYFKNIVDYRLTVLRGNQIDGYSQAIDDMRVVLRMLDQELSN